MNFVINRDSHLPLVDQLSEQIRQAIDEGELEPGATLPTIRDAAQSTGANANTVAAAYRSLEGEGYLVQRKRAGTRVAEHPPRSSERALVTLLASQLASQARRAGIQEAEIARALAVQSLRSSAGPVRVAVLARTPLEAATLAERAQAALGSASHCIPLVPNDYRSVDYHLTIVDPALTRGLAAAPASADATPAPHHLSYGPEFPAGAD